MKRAHRIVGIEQRHHRAVARTLLARRFLRVLEGGTQPTSRHLADPSAPTRRGYVGRHFSGVEAAEA